MPETLDILRWFAHARVLDRESDRARLESRQARLLQRLEREVLPRSPFYAALPGGTAWPVMDKALWMREFDRINTAGIALRDALALAESAERTRDFTTTLHGFTVGLSSGTSGQRGVFLLSGAERRRWAGVILAKLMPPRPWRPRRVAFWLRANSALYESSGRSRLVSFHFFDLLEPLEAQLARVQALAPQVLIAPPSVLRLLAEHQLAGRLQLAPEKLVSVAEVLHVDDRALIERAFGTALAEVYQATEGLLATTCERGALHLNEAFVKIECEWIDRASGRFVPLVTDLTRTTQPVVRYRLDDVLRLAPEPCPCGRATRTLAAIEGRCDELCSFATASGAEVRVFPDFISRTVLGADPCVRDFRALQTAPGALDLGLLLAAESDRAATEARVVKSLAQLAVTLGALPPRVKFVPFQSTAGAKRQRVRCAGAGKSSKAIA